MFEMFFRKAISLAHPLGFVWLLLTFWVLSVLFFRRSRAAVLPALAWVLLTLATCTPLCSWLLAGLEYQTAPRPVEELPVSDVIVCLGGGAEPSRSEPTGLFVKRGSNRITTALLLAARQKAPVLVLGGGGYPEGSERLSEADALARYLQYAQLTQVEVVSLGLCWDTRDEALRVADQAGRRGWQSILLITSASHMPRAAATFEKAGLRVTRVPCDYQSSFNRVGDVDWVHLPSSESLQAFSTWIHEVIGSWVYRWRGWI